MKAILLIDRIIFFNLILTHGQKRGKITSNLIDCDGKSIADIPFQESRWCWKYGNGHCKKNAPESAEESPALWQKVIRTARSSRQDANEVDRKVNLGGIAEVVFRPMCGAGGVFSFPFRSYRNQLRVIY